MEENAGAGHAPPSRILPWIVAVGFFMQMLDGTILNTALPGIAAEMNEAPLRMRGVVIAYLVTAALIIPASGWLADRFGAKRVFILAMGIFALGSLLCALSTSLGFMIAARVVQGVGGALMVPIGRLIAIRSYPRSEMVRILSFITIPGLLGPLLGPATGGFLVQYASWHWIFLINIPVGVAGCILALACMPDIPAESASARFDFSGFLLFGASMVLISIALEGMGEAEISKSRGALLVGLGLACLALYWLRAARIPAPLFQPSLFRIPAFSVGILGNVFSRLGSGAMPFLMPMYLQVGLGFTPLQSGLAMMPGAVASFTGKSLISRLIERFGLRKFLVFNTLAMGVMFCTFALNDARAHPAMLLAQLFVFGIFNSMQFTAMNTVTLFDLPDSQTGQGNSMLSVTMQISSSCGVAVAAALLGYFTAQFELVSSFRSTFVCIGAISVVTCCIFSRLPAEVGRKQ